MRVLYVNHTGRMSGGELSLLALLEALPAEIEAHVACPDGPLRRRLEDLGIGMTEICGTEGSLRLHPTGTPRAVLDIVRAGRQVRRLATAWEADLIHANSIRAGIIATGPGGTKDRPTVVHIRDCLPPGRMSSLSLRAISRADLLIANSEYTRSTLGPAAESAVVVHNAVDLGRFAEAARLTQREARLRLGISKRRPVLGVVAQITPWKAQDDAIEVAAMLRSAHPDLQLLLVGSPKFTGASTRYDNTAYFESLRERVRRHGLNDAVHFLGEREDIPEIMRALDVLLAPSWEEPFGRTIIEAMAAGVPVAATEVGGPPEILDGSDCGVLLPPRAPERWAAELSRLLADRSALAAMGERGEAAARERFGMERHVARVREAYEEALPTAVLA